MWWIYDHGLGVPTIARRSDLKTVFGDHHCGVSKWLRIKWVRQGHRLGTFEYFCVCLGTFWYFWVLLCTFGYFWDGGWWRVQGAADKVGKAGASFVKGCSTDLLIFLPMIRSLKQIPPFPTCSDAHSSRTDSRIYSVQKLFVGHRPPTPWMFGEIESRWGV